jgi:hypothetical protein
LARSYSPDKGVVLTVTLRRAAIVIGVALLGVCCIAGWFTEPPLSALVRMISGFYGLMMILLGLAPSTQKRSPSPSSQSR